LTCKRLQDINPSSGGFLHKTC